MNTKKSFGQRMKKSWQKGDITMWIMLLPTIFFILVMSVYPFLWLIRYVFYDYSRHILSVWTILNGCLRI